MYIQRNKSRGPNGKIYSSTFLCHKYRENGKIKTKVLANLSKLPNNIVVSIANLLKHGNDALVKLSDIIVPKVVDFGLVYIILFLLKKLRISDVLHKTVPELAPRLELIIIGKIVTRGSKLGIYNWLYRHKEIAERLNIDLETLNVDDLYQALGAASFYQKKIEKKWFLFHKGKHKEIFLYDITSTYFEGVKNELAAFGYNRDGKKGKMQINIGLITDKEGFPLTIKVFEGNITDGATVEEQLKKLKNDFEAEHLIFVGDRGMKIKYNLDKMEDGDKAGIDYITGLERNEIKQLLDKGIIQLSLFNKDLAEVEHSGDRYILSENPDLKDKEQKFLNDMYVLSQMYLLPIKESWEKRHNQNQNNIEKLKNGHKNKKLVTEFSKKKIDNYTVRCSKELDRCKMKKYYEIEITNDKFRITFNNEKFTQDLLLAGKYIVGTSVKQKQVRENYKALSNVEHAFRDFKSDNIQIRPVYHRNENQTRGHVLISMFAYAIIKEMENKIFPFMKSWNKSKKRQLAFDDILEELQGIKKCEMKVPDSSVTIKFSELNQLQIEILGQFGLTKKQLDNEL
jgi:transposase